MARLLLPLLLVSAALPAAAIQTRPMKGDRIAIVVAERSRDDRIPAYVARHLVDELRDAGFDAHRVASSLERYENDQERSADHYVIEIEDAFSDRAEWGGVGVGRRRAGAEVSIVSSRLSARVRVYDAASLVLVDEFTVSRTITRPALTGIGVGGRDGFLFFSLPVMYRTGYGAVARKLAAEIVDEIRAGRIASAE